MEEEVAEGLSGALRSVLPCAGLEKGSCQLDGEAFQLLTGTQDFTCFSSLAQGVCAVLLQAQYRAEHGLCVQAGHLLFQSVWGEV